MTFQRKTSKNRKVLRILHVISHYELGGAESCTFELSRLLNGRIEIGVAAVLGSDHSDMGQSLTQYAKRNGVPIYAGTKIPWKFGGFMAAAFRLRHIIRHFGPDIVHLNTEIPEFAFVLCLLMDKSLRGINVVRTIHNTNLWPRWAFLGKRCERRLGDATTVYVSDAVGDSFQRWRKICGLEPIADGPTIYNPITVPRIRESLLDSRTYQNEIRLLFAGRFEYQKGCDLLPEILRRVRIPPSKKLKLFIYGSGSLEGIMQELRDSPPQGWEIELCAPKSNLVETLPDFDVLLFPSRFEGYGRLAAEAVLTGIPVVAFRLPVLFEVFPHNYPWLSTFSENDLSDFVEKVSSLLVCLEAAQKPVEEAQNLLRKKLDPEKTALAFLQLYKSQAGMGSCNRNSLG